MPGSWPGIVWGGRGGGYPVTVGNFGPLRKAAACVTQVLCNTRALDPKERYASSVQFLGACSYVLEARRSSAGAGAGETVAESALGGQETVTLGSAPSPPPTSSPDREPARGHGGDSWPPADDSPAPPPPPLAPPPDRGGLGATLRRRWGYAALLATLVAAAVAVVLLSSSSNTNAGKPSSAALAEVPTNNVTGSGSATVRLKGNVASVSLTTNGLDYEEALGHALHIHAGGKGICPPASAAKLHNGHLSISTTDGIKYYGPPVQALTTHGDTSTASILVFARYPTGGKIRYTRTFTLPASVAKSVRENNAVIVVHGTDYDHSGIYSGVLERSELNRPVPATATALCGPLVRGRMTASLSPARQHRPLVYTASLLVDPYAAFVCEAAGGIPLGSERRRAVARNAAQSSA